MRDGIQRHFVECTKLDVALNAILMRTKPLVLEATCAESHFRLLGSWVSGPESCTQTSSQAES